MYYSDEVRTDIESNYKKARGGGRKERSTKSMCRCNMSTKHATFNIFFPKVFEFKRYNRAT